MDGIIPSSLDREDFFAVIQRDSDFFQLSLEQVDDLGIGELQQARTLVDEGGGNFQRGEDGGILGADDSASDDDDRVGNAFQSQEAIRINDTLVIERNVRWSCRFCPYGDGYEVRRQFQRTAGRLYAQAVRIDKAGGTEKHIDLIPGHLVLHDLNPVFHDVVG